MDKGMMLKKVHVSGHDIRLDVVTCDCCGGWSTEGIECENCKADAEGMPRPIVWVDEKDYPAAMKEYRKKTERGDEHE
jgi:hypothetical protein